MELSGILRGRPSRWREPSGRNNGAVIWGDIKGGKFSYFAGVFDNGNIASSPLFSGKLRLALLDPEPGFWGNGSYFGDKDILSIDVGGQVQDHGSSAAGATRPTPRSTSTRSSKRRSRGGSWFTAGGSLLPL